jgi:hypothetical protein
MRWLEMHKFHRGQSLEQDKAEEWALDNVAGLRERTQSGGRSWFNERNTDFVRRGRCVGSAILR